MAEGLIWLGLAVKILNKENFMKILKTFVFPALFVALLVAVDQITKYLAVEYLKPIRIFHIIEGVFSLQFHENPGMAFGLFQGGRWFFIGFTIIILGLFIYYYASLPKTRHRGIIRLFLLMLMGGALGNFADRLFREGYVVDFFSFTLINFPIFNMADVFLVVAVFFLIIFTLFSREQQNEQV